MSTVMPAQNVSPIVVELTTDYQKKSVKLYILLRLDTLGKSDSSVSSP